MCFLSLFCLLWNFIWMESHGMYSSVCGDFCSSMLLHIPVVCSLFFNSNILLYGYSTDSFTYLFTCRWTFGSFPGVIMIKLHLGASLCVYVFQNGCIMLHCHRQVYESSSCFTSSPTLGLARGRIIIASKRWPCPHSPNLWICHLPWQKGLCSYD